MQPHPDSNDKIALKCVVITVSDTRSFADDHSGNLIKSLLRDAGHLTVGYQIIPDLPGEIIAQLTTWQKVDVIILNGGTGISKRDQTVDVVEVVLEQILPGFGELFRMLSYQTIGSRAMASRAIAGVYQEKLIFCLPGSTNGVKLAMEKLIIPELIHLNQQIKQ
ncbi:MAG: MogA/MoaB family molybdenum cofactor biosynthesis protein [Gloeocapsa sp. DLM2.Bin57]|nr:MAG: MogA/MoaB family molybdenum cofactor biosynthesis protein [Gloeocapsa sp. DLM2.Bin57]